MCLIIFCFLIVCVCVCRYHLMVNKDAYIYNEESGAYLCVLILHACTGVCRRRRADMRRCAAPRRGAEVSSLSAATSRCANGYACVVVCPNATPAACEGD